MKRYSQLLTLLFLCFCGSSVSAEPVWTEQGHPLFLSIISVSFLILITAGLWFLRRRAAAQRMAKITQMPIALNNEFLSIVSHELRTPMNGILGSLNLLDKDNLKEEQLICLQQIKASAQDMMYLVSELLDYSAMQANAIQLHETSVNMRDSLLKLFKRVEIRCERKKIKFNGSIADTVAHYAWTDGKKIITVLEHLLDNAWKYTREGSIDCLVSMNEGNQLSIQVSDTGIGIAHQDQKEIFKPFKQVESYAQRSVNGLGLGLSICYAFAKVLRGELTYLVTPTRGSHFLFTLPIRSIHVGGLVQLEYSKFDALIEEKSIERVALEKTNLTPRRTNKKREEIRILIVDDNATNCFVAKGIVKKLGFQPEIVMTGESALSLLSEQEFDLVLMDCQMPVMDGFQVTTKLRQLDHPNNQIPVIAVTANTSTKDHNLCLESGMNDYMTKPINMILLEEKICYWLSLSKKKSPKHPAEKSEDNKVVDWAKYKK